MNIPIIYEDNDLLIIDKPAGVIVNRAETTKHEMTVQDWMERKLKLANQTPRTKNQEQQGGDFYNRGGPPATHDVNISNNSQKQRSQSFSDPVRDFALRAGVVHRLDKETSGILILAKNSDSFTELQRQFKNREVKKVYLALAHGKITPSEGEINVPVGRLPWNRNRFGILPGGRESKTSYKVIQEFQNPQDKEVLSLVELYPQSGRTHQLRVHLKYIGHPIFSDFLYAGRKTAKKDRKILPRVFLHAAKISFVHPTTKKQVSFKSPLPQGLEELLETFSKIV